MKKLTIGLIGNPNSGKTTLFNQLTGARQRVGNWAGVTVERKEGLFSTTDHQVTLVDLPGTYSLTTISRKLRSMSRLPATIFLAATRICSSTWLMPQTLSVTST